MSNHLRKNSFKKLPKEIRENAKKNCGLHATLIAILSQIVDDLVVKYAPIINTSYEKSLPYFLSEEAKIYCEAANLPKELTEYIMGISMSFLSATRHIINTTNFTKWYDKTCVEYGHPIKKDGNRDIFMASRYLRLKPGTTEEEFKDEIRKDMLKRYPRSEVEERLAETYSMSLLNGKKLEPTK